MSSKNSGPRFQPTKPRVRHFRFVTPSEGTAEIPPNSPALFRPLGGCYETRRNSFSERMVRQKIVTRSFHRTQSFSLGSMLVMQLPPVGTSELLRILSPHIPDEFINERFSRQRREGRRLRFNAAQLWRVHLLVLLTRTFSFNALVRLLPEQEQWRRFAHLPNRFALPDVRMLSDFRRCLGAAGLRQINDHLLWELLVHAPLNKTAVAFMDATDLPASTEDKKNNPERGPRVEPPWEPVRAGRVRPVSSSATKSIPCGCGSAATRRGSCLHRWSPGRRRPMFPRAICLNPALGIAGSASTGGLRLSSATWATSTRKLNAGCAPIGGLPCSLGSKRICN